MQNTGMDCEMVRLTLFNVFDRDHFANWGPKQLNLLFVLFLFLFLSFFVFDLSNPLCVYFTKQITFHY